MNEQQRAVVQQLMDAARVAGITVQCAVVQQQVSAALAAGKALLEQSEPVQELVDLQTVYDTIIQWDVDGGKRSRRELARRIVDLYTTPPAQPAAWVGLTADEMLEALIAVDPATKRLPIGFTRFAQAVEAKLREKNGGA
jgi:hypothetical protein